MSYGEAKKIRGQSFGSMMTEKLLGDQGIGESFKSTLSEKTKATTTGIKEKFDPMNIAKFMTGGSNLAPAIVGKLTGRSKEDIQHFAGAKDKKVDTASKLGPLQSSNEMVDMLLKIYNLMQETNEANIKHREILNNFAEEEKLEKARRHKELLDAIRGKKGSEETATKLEQDTGMGVFDIVTNILTSFGGTKTALSVLSSIGKFFVINPIGVALLGGATLLTLLAKDKNPEETNKMIQNATGGPEAEAKAITEAVKNTTAIERRKQNILADRPMSKKSLLFWKDPALQEEYLKEIGWDDKTGLTGEEAKAGFVGLDEEGNPTKKNGMSAVPVNAPTQTPGATTTATEQTTTTTPGASPTGGGESPTTAPPTSLSPGESVVPPKPTTSVTDTGTSTTPATTATVAPVPPVTPSQKLNSVVSENLEMKLPNTESTPTVINNSVNRVTSAQGGNNKSPGLPFVRNQEPTFQRMIFNSTRVV